MRDIAKPLSDMTESDFLMEAKRRLSLALCWDVDSRLEAQSDRDFYSGDQWDPAVRQTRLSQQRPCLTINPLRRMVELILGDYNQSRIGFSPIPKDDASKLSADVLGKYMIDLQRKSNAGYAYEWGFRQALICGRGFWRVVPEYENEESFSMIPVVRRVNDSFLVAIDPYAKEADYSDARYACVIEPMSKEEFQSRYPDADAGQAGPLFTPGYDTTGYNFYFSGSDQTCWVTEYFWIEEKKDLLYEVEIEVQGILEISVFKSSEYKALKKDKSIKYRVLRTREVLNKRVMWSKITSGEVLEDPVEIPCDYIPVVFCPGIEEIREGVKNYVSLIRDSKDSARAYNYSRSTSIENVALSPKVPYLVTSHMINGHESDWNNLNTIPKPYLLYNPDPMAPNARPERVDPPQVQSALANEAMICVEEIKTTTGIYDAARGATTNEVSARAINARSQGTMKANFAFFRSLERAVIFTGKIFLSMIKKLNKEGTNFSYMNNGKIEMYSLSGIGSGNYEIDIDSSPEYETQRKEILANMTDFVRQTPQTASALVDIVAKAQDWPDSDKIAERVRRGLPLEMLSPQEAMSRSEEMAKTEILMQMAKQDVMEEAKVLFPVLNNQDQSQQPPNPDLIKIQLEIEKQKMELEKMRIDLEIEKMKLAQQTEKTKEQSILTDQEIRGMGVSDKAIVKAIARVMKSGGTLNPSGNI